MRTVRKIRLVAKGVVAFAGSLGIALADGHVTTVEACAIVVTVGAVYGIRNGEKPQS